MSTYIHFFDIASKLPGPRQSWSPNTLKARMTLNYKQIPYVESFVSYPDIRTLGLKLGLPMDDSYHVPRPTLPAIAHYQDGKLVKTLMGSIEIGQYLDEVYPNTPPVLRSPSTPGQGLENVYQAYFAAFRIEFSHLFSLGYNIVVPTIPPILDNRGSEYFIKDRAEGADGVSPMDWGAKDPEDDWQPFIKGIERFTRLLAFTTEQQPFLLGSKPMWADFALAGWLRWIEAGSSANFDRVIDVAGGKDGRLANHYKACLPWLEGQGKIVDWKE